MCLLPARGWSTFWRCPPSGVSRFAGHLSAPNRASCSCATGWVSHPGRPTAMATCPSWPDASLRVTARLMKGTWPSGLVSPVATLCVDCAQSVVTCRSAPEAWLTWPDVTPRGADPVPNCSAGLTLAARLGRPHADPGRQPDDRDEEWHLPALRPGRWSGGCHLGHAWWPGHARAVRPDLGTGPS